MQVKMPLWLQITLTLVVGACVFLVGAIPAQGDLGDVEFVQWLLLVVFLGGLMGITVTTRPDPTVVARVSDSGSLTAGEAARYTTGSTVTNDMTLRQLVDPHATRLGRHEGEPVVDTPPVD
jgi:hypothetical protein